MELTKTEVFECPKCESLSKNKEDVIKCLQRHRKEELKAEKERAFFDLQDKLSFILINNLKSFRSEDVKSLLVDAAKMVGYKLDITISNPSKIAANHYGKLCVNYSVSGSFKKVGTSEFSGVRTPNSCAHYIRGLLDKKQSAYVGDLFRLIKGIDIYSGGGGAESFSYTLNLLVDQFPDLKNYYDEFKTLSGAETLLNEKVASLKAEFNRNILPSILHSDIPYQEIKMEYDELYDEISQLNSKIKQISVKMSKRADDLASHHSARFVTPDPSFEYDSERLAELKEKLF